MRVVTCSDLSGWLFPLPFVCVLTRVDDWVTTVPAGLIEYLDVNEESVSFLALREADIDETTTHSASIIHIVSLSRCLSLCVACLVRLYSLILL